MGKDARIDAMISERDRKERVVIGSAKTERKITQQELEDMLTTAFEGGSNYWCSSIRITKTNQEIPEQEFLANDIASGRVLEIAVYDNEEVDENDRPKRHLVTREKLIQAFQIMADQEPGHFQDFLNDNCDAITGDVWFQCAVFGKSIYG